jgi:hypothetical protein
VVLGGRGESHESSRALGSAKANRLAEKRGGGGLDTKRACPKFIRTPENNASVRFLKQ